MATNIIHRVNLQFKTEESASKFESCIRQHMWDDIQKDLGFYPLNPIFKTLLQGEQKKEPWYLDPNKADRKQLHILQRTKSHVKFHFCTPYAAHADFFEDIDVDVWGIQSIEGYYYDEFGAYTVGTFSRSAKGWHHDVLHQDDMINPDKNTNYFATMLSIARKEIQEGDSENVTLSYDVCTFGDRKGAIYKYSDPMESDFLHHVRPMVSDESSWQVNDEQTGEVHYPTVYYDCTDFACSVHLSRNVSQSDTMEVHYSGRISIEFPRSLCAQLLRDVEKKGWESLSFSFVIHGSTYEPHYEGGLPIRFSGCWSTPLTWVRVEPIDN